MEDIERGLWEIARCNGNTYRAARELQERGYPISRSRLENWKNRDHRERYLEIEAQLTRILRALVEGDVIKDIMERPRNIREGLFAAAERGRQGRS